MNVRWFVYDIRGQMEEFVASFSSHDDAVMFGNVKFGPERAYITDVPHHDKVKLGIAKKARKRAPVATAKPHMPRWR